MRLFSILHEAITIFLRNGEENLPKKCSNIYAISSRNTNPRQEICTILRQLRQNEQPIVLQKKTSDNIPISSMPEPKIIHTIPIQANYPSILRMMPSNHSTIKMNSSVNILDEPSCISIWEKRSPMLPLVKNWFEPFSKIIVSHTSLLHQHFLSVQSTDISLESTTIVQCVTMKSVTLEQNLILKDALPLPQMNPRLPHSKNALFNLFLFLFPYAISYSPHPYKVRNLYSRHGLLSSCFSV